MSELFGCATCGRASLEVGKIPCQPCDATGGGPVGCSECEGHGEVDCTELDYWSFCPECWAAREQERRVKDALISDAWEALTVLSAYHGGMASPERFWQRAEDVRERLRAAIEGGK